VELVRVREHLTWERKMKGTQVLLATLALILTPLSTQAQSVTKVNFTTEQLDNFTPIPGKLNPQIEIPAKPNPHDGVAWWCTTPPIGVCLYTMPAYIGMACGCCNAYYGCYVGRITGLSSLEHPDNHAENR
jgi:hypothetical protein